MTSEPPPFVPFRAIPVRRSTDLRDSDQVTRFIDPATGRPYEVGPDGVPTWLDDPAAPASARPWYRKVRYVAPAAAVLGFAVAAGADGSASPTPPATRAAPEVTVTATSTTTATVTATPTALPAATVTRTVTPRPRTVRVTVTRTATVQPLAGGGTGGGAAYYANCSQARAAGAAPLYVGDPGYRPGLDRDGDGVACE